MDHREHSVQIIATEWGIADLRGRSPYERAVQIIDHCAHPDFRKELRGALSIQQSADGAESIPRTFVWLNAEC